MERDNGGWSVGRTRSVGVERGGDGGVSRACVKRCGGCIWKSAEGVHGCVVRCS